MIEGEGVDMQRDAARPGATGPGTARAGGASRAHRHGPRRGQRAAALVAGPLLALGGLVAQASPATAAGSSSSAGPAAGSASGATGGVAAASASGSALVLKVLGQLVATEGLSKVDANVTGTSAEPILNVVAEGIGALTPLATTAEEQATANSTHTEQAVPQRCGTPALPTLPIPLELGLACASAQASAAGGLPVADATGSVARITLDLSGLLDQVVGKGTPLAGALSKVLGALPSNAATETVSQVLSTVLKTATTTETLAVSLGSSTSSVTTTTAAMTSSSTDQGGTISILPDTPGGPLAEIVVGSASASALAHRTGPLAGKASADYSPAIVTVVLNTPLTGKQTISLGPGQTETILAGTPLQSTITVAGGSTTTNPDGSVTATADGVSLDLLQGVGASSPTADNGGILLDLAHAQASAGAKPAAVLPATTPRAAAPAAPAAPAARAVAPARATLPFTGEPPWIPVAGLGLLAGAVVTRRLATRRR
jgi:hypothetical protein